MAETKDQISAERDALRAENENLKGQLAASGGRVYQPAATFQLTEGARQELLANGVTVIGGQRMTVADVYDRLSPEERESVDLGDKEPVDAAAARTPHTAIPGVDFIYPSVAPGKIDPKVAGTPGISGPPATAADVAPPATDPADFVDDDDDQV